MEHKEELIEKVERYLSGKLSREEVKEGLDQDLSSEELDEFIDAFKTSKQLIELSGLREDLKSIQEEYFAENEKPPKRNSIWLWATIAMAAALMAIVIFSGILKPGPPVFEDYFTPYDNIVSIRGDEGDLNKAMSLYSMEKYKEALAEFAKIKADTISQTLLFYEAISALAISELDLAVENLNTLSNTNNNIYWQQTKWYLALALWQKGEIDESKEKLLTIQEDEKQYALAKELIKSL